MVAIRMLDILRVLFVFIVGPIVIACIVAAFLPIIIILFIVGLVFIL
jgi:hypothetical protein